MKNKMVIESSYDVEIESEVEKEIETALKEIVVACSKKYMRNIKTSVSIEVK